MGAAHSAEGSGPVRRAFPCLPLGYSPRQPSCCGFLSTPRGGRQSGGAWGGGLSAAHPPFLSPCLVRMYALGKDMTGLYNEYICISSVVTRHMSQTEA